MRTEVEPRFRTAPWWWPFGRKQEREGVFVSCNAERASTSHPKPHYCNRRPGHVVDGEPLHRCTCGEQWRNVRPLP